ncbi:MAG TPA: MlaD family protein [Acidimicrobiales bacterium]|nr:MlaD family protein [Acidimicrobiales bacterium]
MAASPTSLARRFVGYGATAVVVVGLLAALVVWRTGGGGGYQVTIVFPEATDLNTGSLVEVRGTAVGKVSHLGLSDGQAMVTVTLDSASTPLHTGTAAKIDYKALLGERYVELVPGAAGNPEIPSGGVITGGEDRVELQDVLNALDPATRKQLADLIPQLQQTLGDPVTVNQTLTAAAPATTALAQLLDAVGSNGAALHQLVATMADLSTRLVNQQGALVSTVQGLTQANSAIAGETGQLATGLAQLPRTLQQATTVLDKLPATTAAVVPLLDDLAPGAAALPAFSADLKPVLDQLSPVLTQLQPSLGSLHTLLGATPALATTANATLPGVTQATSTLTAPQKVTVPTDANGTTTKQVTTTVLDWVRAYTPELAAFQTNWGDWLAAYNGSGHIGPFTAVFGIGQMTGQTATPNGYRSPATTSGGVALPQTATNGPPFPGTVAGQPCTTCYQATDAAGNPVG